MAKTASFTKRALITKANQKIVLTTAVASFVIVFCMIASRSLISQASYQTRVISAKKKALSVLKKDLNERQGLVASYKAFVGNPENILAGSSSGTGDKDGDNAKIILDALPSKYDFPALTSSIEKLVASQGLSISGISGSDQELAQAESTTGDSPQPVAMPFQVKVAGSYNSVKGLVDALERSIRPMQVQKVELSGSEGNMVAVIDAQTFYQPQLGLNIRNEVVK